MSAITPTNQVTTLANSILQNFDANHDGSLSSDEFTTFLSQLLGNVATPPPPAGTGTGTGTGAGTGAGTGTASTTPAELSTLYSTVSDTAAPRTRVGNMVGFDDEKLRDQSHTSFKYQIGRILQYYPNTPEGLRQALPEIQKLVPNAKIIGTHGDKIDFGDYNDPKSGHIGVVDVLLAAGEGGRGWAWQPVEEAKAAPVPPTLASPKQLISTPPSGKTSSPTRLGDGHVSSEQTSISSPSSGKASVSAGSAGRASGSAGS